MVYSENQLRVYDQKKLPLDTYILNNFRLEVKTEYLQLLQFSLPSSSSYVYLEHGPEQHAQDAVLSAMDRVDHFLWVIEG